VREMLPQTEEGLALLVLHVFPSRVALTLLPRLVMCRRQKPILHGSGRWTAPSPLATPPSRLLLYLTRIPAAFNRAHAFLVCLFSAQTAVFNYSLTHSLTDTPLHVQMKEVDKEEGIKICGMSGEAPWVIPPFVVDRPNTPVA
jgi:hypothetical protein